MGEEESLLLNGFLPRKSLELLTANSTERTEFSASRVSGSDSRLNFWTWRGLSMGVTKGGKTSSPQKMFIKGHTPRLSELGECCDDLSQGDGGYGL